MQKMTLKDLTDNQKLLLNLMALLPGTVVKYEQRTRSEKISLRHLERKDLAEWLHNGRDEWRLTDEGKKLAEPLL